MADIPVPAPSANNKWIWIAGGLCVAAAVFIWWRTRNGGEKQKQKEAPAADPPAAGS